MLNLDTKPLDNPKVRTLITDITDTGQVFNALSSYTGLHEFDPSLQAAARSMRSCISRRSRAS